VEANYLRRFLEIWVLAAAVLACAAAVPAQDDLEYEIAPPPMKLVAKEDLTRLDAVAMPKDKTKLALRLMDERLAGAERLNTAARFEEMFTELGRFGGLLDYTLSYLGKQDQNDKRVLDSYKRFEIAIRAHMGRLEVVRRELPIKYEKFVRDLIKSLRTARQRALDPQFSDTVVPEEQKP
jgi:hypothetical protein